MGQGFYSQCYNDWGSSFVGTDIEDNCMYDQQDLASLPTGSSSFYIQMNDGGGCFFQVSYIFEAFALPGSPAGQYNFILGVGSGAVSLSQKAPWIVQEVQYNIYNYYMWTLPGGVPAKIQGITGCDYNYCIGWLIPSAAEAGLSGKVLPTAEFTPFKTRIPKEGSDRQGPPK